MDEAKTIDNWLIVVLWRFLRRVFRPRLRPERPALPAP